MGRPLVLILQNIYERLLPMLEMVLKCCDAVVFRGGDMVDNMTQSNSQSNSMSVELTQERVLCTMNALMITSAHHPLSISQSNSHSVVSWIDLLQEMITESEQGLGPQGQGLGPDSTSITTHYRGVLWRDLLRLIPQTVKGCMGDSVEGGYLLNALLEGGHLETLLPSHLLGTYLTINHILPCSRSSHCHCCHQYYQ